MVVVACTGVVIPRPVIVYRLIDVRVMVSVLIRLDDAERRWADVLMHDARCVLHAINNACR